MPEALFKSDFNPNAIIHSICAFANDIDNLGGGYIIIGTEEKDGLPVFPLKGIEQSRIGTELTVGWFYRAMLLHIRHLILNSIDKF